MREIKRENNEDAIRQVFEEYSDGKKDVLIKGAIGTAVGAIKAFAAGGPIAMAIAIPVGILTTFWKTKAYREQAYAYYDSLGIIKKPARRYRSLMYSYTSEAQGWRYRYGELLADIVVEILAEEYPSLTESELATMGLASLRTLHEVRKTLPEVPVEIAADVILESYGIHKLPTGEYHYRKGEYSPWGHHFPVHVIGHHAPPPVAKIPSWVWMGIMAVLIYRMSE